MATSSSTLLEADKHVDALAVGRDAIALATSSLTGDVWDGRLMLLRAPEGAPGGLEVVAELTTPAGNSDVAWVQADVLASGDDHGDVTLWQRSEKALSNLVTFREHAGPVTAVAPMATLPRLASTSLDGTAKVWDAVVSGGPALTLEHLPVHSWCDVNVHAAVWFQPSSSEMLATGASDGVVRLWDARQPKPAATRFAAHSAPFLSLSTGAADSHLLAGSECGSLHLLDVRKLDAPVTTTAASSAAITSLRAAPPPSNDSGTPLIAAGSEDGSIAIVDPRDLHRVTTIAAHTGNVPALAWLGVGPDFGLSASAGTAGSSILVRDRGVEWAPLTPYLVGVVGAVILMLMPV